MDIILPSPVIKYVLVRTDAIDWNVGKFLAQTDHCGTEMTEVLREKNFPDLNALYSEWKSDPMAEAVWQKACEDYSDAEDQIAIKITQTIMNDKRKIADDLVRKFGTVLTLAVTAAEMRQAVSLAQLLGLHAGIINDPTYPIRDGDRFTTASVDTCAYIFGRKDACQPVVGRFELFGSKHVP